MKFEIDLTAGDRQRRRGEGGKTIRKKEKYIFIEIH